MGKEESDTFFLSHWGYLELFLQKCLLSSPLRFIRLLSDSVNLIGCRRGKKVSIFVEMFKNLLLRNHKRDEA